MAASSRDPMFAPWLDLRAYKIGDPVERLRFLRREMQALESEVADTTRSGRLMRNWNLTGNWKWIAGTGFALVAILAR